MLVAPTTNQHSYYPGGQRLFFRCCLPEGSRRITDRVPRIDIFHCMNRLKTSELKDFLLDWVAIVDFFLTLFLSYLFELRNTHLNSLGNFKRSLLEIGDDSKHSPVEYLELHINQKISMTIFFLSSGHKWPHSIVPQAFVCSRHIRKHHHRYSHFTSLCTRSRCRRARRPAVLHCQW